MAEIPPGRAPAVTTSKRSQVRSGTPRAGLRAVVLASVALLGGVATAQAAGTGGLGTGGGGGSTGSGDGSGSATTASGCSDTELGRRTLEFGDCGVDVQTLNWILRAKDFGAPLVDQFESSTESAVADFQRDADLGATGVADRATTASLARAMPKQRATWYGPGFFGNETACGKTLSRATTGVAHRSLPCGTKVVIRYHGRYVRTTVIDRGPYANGAKWDLTEATAEALRLGATDDIRVAKLVR